MKIAVATLSLAIVAGLVVIAEDEKSVVEIQLSLELPDGSILKGQPKNEKLAIHSQYGLMQVPLERISRLQVHPDKEGVSLTLRNRDTVTGVLGSEPLQLETLLGPLTVDFEHVKAFSVVRMTPAMKALSKDLILYYSFDQKGPRVENRVDQKLNGTSGSAEWIPDGKVGGAYVFDSYKYITVKDHPALSPEQLTIACWVHPTSSGSWNGAVMKATAGSWSDGYGLSMYSGDRDNIYFFVNYYSSYRVKAPIKLKEWAHIAGTFDGNELRIYKNGGLIDTMTHNAPLKSNALDLYIGQGTSNYPWKGALDEVMILNRALSADEVNALYGHFAAQ
ncbi:MAG: LamG domain-containing protein [Verrucomicrobiota bacterium]